MNLRVVLQFDDEVGAWSAICPELPGCASAGDSKEEALVNIREAIDVYLASEEFS
jgi:predicted RNase H-like HicB family nuclease